MGGRDFKQAARDAIEQQIEIIQKKEDYLQKKIGDDLKKAKANVVSNKTVAIQALRRKKYYEVEMERLNGLRLQLDQQINTLESGNLDLEAMQVTRKGSDVQIHGRLAVNEVDAVMKTIPAQGEISCDLSGAISQLIDQTDETELMEELVKLEQAQLDERLAAAEHNPSGALEALAVADDELRELQAGLAM